MPPRAAETIQPTTEEIAAQIYRVRIDIAVGTNHLKNLQERFDYYYQDLKNYQAQLNCLLNQDPTSDCVEFIYEKLFGLSYINQGLRREYYNCATEVNHNKQKLIDLSSQVQ